MRELTVCLPGGARIVVPAAIDAMTTYILLEQEAWFEKEWSFLPRLAKPGMTVIDIGANVGVYALVLARLVGPEGRVYAYEPGSEVRALLETSRARNGADNLTILPLALSDRPRSGMLAFAKWSELRSLGGDGTGESIAISSLDEEDRLRGWASPDFVKIDAEGEERRILEGGKDFFARHSPLVMFEIKTDGKNDTNIAGDFRALGYGIYRLTYGTQILVPVEDGNSLDPADLNLFAAKPDRAASLAKDGVLVERVAEWTKADAASARPRIQQRFREQAFYSTIAGLLARPLDPDYGNALASYAAWRSSDLPWPVRYGALRFAYSQLTEICNTAPNSARLSTLARVVWDAGDRANAFGVLRRLMEFGNTEMRLIEPFWPANPRFDQIAPGDAVGPWFVVSALEQLEKTSALSSFWGATAMLDWLCTQPFLAVEMERRIVLHTWRSHTPMAVRERLRSAQDGHLNAALWDELWRSGPIPNILVSTE